MIALVVSLFVTLGLANLVVWALVVTRCARDQQDYRRWFCSEAKRLQQPPVYTAFLEDSNARID